MNRVFIFIFLFGSYSMLYAQDTVRTNFPDSRKVWNKVYEGARKTQDLIYWENGREWMTAKYDTADVEYWKWYHENGNPYWEATIIKDELQGIYKIWYENGHLAEELTFLNNLEDGPATLYYQNGKVAAKGKYRQGKMIGEWKFFNEQGHPFEGDWTWPFAAETETNRMEGAIQRGIRIGLWTYQTTAGGLKRRIFSDKFE